MQLFLLVYLECTFLWFDLLFYESHVLVHGAIDLCNILKKADYW